MILKLSGHDYKYAVEQIMLMIYPKQLPEYSPSGSDDLSADSQLRIGKVYATAVTRITTATGSFSGTARVQCIQLTGKLETDRLLQKIIKLSFYKAAVLHTGVHPAWGALTGIRPGKLVTSMLNRGVSEKAALRALSHKYFVSPARGALCIDTAKASQTVNNTLSDREVALYIGIPFCPTRCHYCSFVSHSVEKSIKLIVPFLDALLKEIDTLSSVVRENDLKIIAVYIGGGTPTTLTAEQLRLLMQKIEVSFDMTSVREYTVEAGRPDTITKEKLMAIFECGAERVSVNPQTMNDDVLNAIGRQHSAQDVITAYTAAREVGFSCVNMDLIAGLPGDTAQSFKNSLDSLLQMQPENITVHTLSLKKGTKVKLDKIGLPDDSIVANMLSYAEQRLRASGYLPYYLYRQKFMSGGFENVGWCRPGFESLYNILIMEELATILAAGGGGVTKLVGRKNGRIERIFNVKYPYEYIETIDNIIEKKDKITQFYADKRNFI